ncbi:MAG TPA: hypothetical protein VEQ86_00450 [Xanthobacteraceae bacterium]|nr:hypothetical protein [Xanthobacteraceae bacterium]
MLMALLVLMPPKGAAAADVIFPAGSRLGLVPPPGMVPSRTFQGFEEPGTKAAILLTTLPADAYEQLAKSMVPETMKKEGIEAERREAFELPAGKGFVLTGRQTIEKERYRKWLLIASADDLTALVNVQVPEQATNYSAEAVRAAFATLAVRAQIPEAEQLTLIPFRIGELAGFHVEDVLPGRAIVLVDPPSQTADGASATAKARMFISALPGGPGEAADRDNFARVAFGQIVGIKDVRLQDAGPLRIANQPGYQTLAKAKDAGTGIDVMVVQWLRFGSGGFLRMIGIARADVWPEMFGRLRAVRDGVATN